MYKIKPVKGDRIVTKSETEIFPITGWPAGWW
jgi:hypothetical protein